MKASSEQVSSESPAVGTVRGERPADDCADPPAKTAADIAHRQVPVEQLLKTIEVDLIPRLLVSHLVDSDSTEPVSPVVPSTGLWSSVNAVREFSIWCVEQDNEAINRHISRLLASGIQLDSIYLHLLAPTAQWLGDQWLEDELTFVDVSLGLCCLHRLLCDCESVGFCQPPGEPRQSILLSAAPGDQHTFGVAMAADFYRRYGWQVNHVSGCSREAILSALECTKYTAMGLSLHNEEMFSQLQSLIAAARKRSLNERLLIIVGGEYFLSNPTMVERSGADLFAVDGHKAVLDTKAALQCEMSTA